MFSEQRRLSLQRKQVLHDYLDILQDNDYRYYCLSRDSVMVIVSYLNWYGLHDGNYFVEKDDYHYLTPNATQYAVIQDVIEEAIDAMASGEIFDMSGVITAINGVAAKIDDVELAVSLSGNCGCVTTGTSVTNPTNTTLVECVPPTDDWELWEDYKTYSCKAAVWTWDQIKIFSEKAKLLYFDFYQDYYSGTANSRMGLQEVYLRAAQSIGQQLNPLFLYNLNEGNKAFLAQYQADLYYKFATDYFLRVPETHTGAQVITDWYGTTFDEIQDYLDTEKSNFISDMYNAEDGDEARGYVNGLIDGAIAQAIALGGTQLGLDEITDIMDQLKSNGVPELGFSFAPQLDAFIHAETCTGDKGCTAPSDCWVSTTLGQHTGGDTWNTEYNSSSGMYEVDVLFDDGTTTLDSGSQLGLTSPSGRNIWHVYDAVGLQYDSDTNPSISIADLARVHVASSTSGSIDLVIDCGGA